MSESVSTESAAPAEGAESPAPVAASAPVAKVLVRVLKTGTHCAGGVWRAGALAQVAPEAARALESLGQATIVGVK